MSSYNENLHATVVASLQEQEQDEKLMLSKLDASIITLYYAEGARITAAENLGLAVKKLAAQSALMEQAANNSNISVNLLMSANQQKAYTAQSVTNTAVGASNIQIASNAIVRLAADLGGVFAILSAADFGSDIYDQSKLIREFINDTAYAAKNVALSAMDSSKLIAEVSSPAIVDAAKLTNDSIASLFQIISSDFDAMTATVFTDDAALSAANSIEKVAQGKLETINVEYFATQTAHCLNNKELNIDLIIGEVKSNSFEVFFDPLANPFEDTNLIVNNYKIIVVKDAAKSVFSIINAENILLNNESASPQSVLVPPLDKKMSIVIFNNTLKDSDNDDIVLGTDYVVFVYALLLEPYKKSINNFNDYLSAPSESFILTNTLKSPDNKTISVTINGTVQQLNFEVPPIQVNVEYRCMFLPYSPDLTKGLLTENMLRTQLNEIKRLKEISDIYEPQYATMQAKLNDQKAINDSLLQENNMDKDDLLNGIKNNNDDTSKTQKSFKSLQKLEQEAIQSLLAPQNPSPGFFFNLNLAEQVSAANYEAVQAGPIIINADTTDNFGNFLISGVSYVPAILTISKEPEENQAEFTNALSDFTITVPFVYSAKN